LPRRAGEASATIMLASTAKASPPRPLCVDAERHHGLKQLAQEVALAETAMPFLENVEWSGTPPSSRGCTLAATRRLLTQLAHGRREPRSHLFLEHMATFDDDL
jgi:hypothetical protein